MDLIDSIASKMREAYAEFDPQKEPLVPWSKAADQKKEAWRVCARAAMGELRGATSEKLGAL